MAYAELHCHSNFSFLDGASHPETLARRASELGYAAIALTDHNGLYGIVRFDQAARRCGIKALIGSELTLTSGHHIVLLARNAEGYANLCQIVSTAALNNPKGEARTAPETLQRHRAGLIALSGCSQGEIPSLLREHRHADAARRAARYREIFGPDNFYLELQHHKLPLHQTLCEQLAELGQRLKIPCVATNNVHYASRDDRPLQDVLTCIRHHTTVDRAGSLLYPNAERYLKSPRAMCRRFAPFPDAIARTLEISERCRFSFDDLTVSLPDFPTPKGETPASHLRTLTYRGARERYGELCETVVRQLEHELGVIHKLDMAGYFLIVWDIARFCREQKILCQGRGSAANSAVCYALGITAVDPIKLQLLFERFLSKERKEPPDIDIDIANNRREEVIQYVYEKYGREHAAMVCEVIAYRGRSAVREVGKALGFANEEIGKLSKLLGHYAGKELTERIADAGFNPNERRVSLLSELACKILRFPRHLGIHVGGMVVTRKPLSHTVPVENATMPNRSVVQWDKDDCQDAGLVKIDLLGLGMLTLIDDALKLVRKHRGIEIDVARLAYDDPKVYDLICRAETVGVFQVESRAQMNTLPRHKPRCFYDLVVEVALIRPGPIQGNMVHPYLRRRNGEEPVTYPHPALEPILKRTLGIPLFQEQGMQIAIAAAGFTPTEADALRRAMGHKRSRERMEELSLDLVAGMVRNGITEAAAFRIFEQLSAFADFGFAESHAASFALLVYVSAYLKVYYPQEFYAAILNAQPMGFYSPSSIVFEARRRGIEIAPIDLSRSRWECTVEEERVRLGLKYIKKLGDSAKAVLERESARGPFSSVEDFVRRTQLNSEALERVALSGAFRCFGLTRRQALWKVLALARNTNHELPLESPERGIAQIPPMLTGEALAADFQTTNLSTGPHPMLLFRAELKKQNVCTARDLEGVANGSGTTTAGIVVIRQRPVTAKGFLFITLEDETGFINVVVKPDVLERFRRTVIFANALFVKGKVECKDRVINVVGEYFLPLTKNGNAIKLRSRDFR